MIDINEIFWNASVEDLKQGYINNTNDEEYICLLCGKTFIKGVIYKEEDQLLEASRAIKIHIKKEHNSVFDYLINMNRKFTGLTDHQKEVLQYFYKGLSDKEIIEEMGGGSTSTIRNHRFKLKEKEKQAKVFSAIMGLIQNKEQDKQQLISIHKGAKMVDERYAISNEEMEKVINTYFINEDSIQKLKTFPSKEKRKIVVLKHILNYFENNRTYTEKEVNEILLKIYDDFVTLRRYMIEYGYMERSKDCSQYWVKN